MVVGPFGGGSGSRDFACVMSLDGAVTVYEQQAFGFRTALPNYLHPFPIKYVRSVDAFITLNADLCLVCYKWVKVYLCGLLQYKIWREKCTSGSGMYNYVLGSRSIIYSLQRRASTFVPNFCSTQHSSVTRIFFWGGGGRELMMCLHRFDLTSISHKLSIQMSRFYQYLCFSSCTTIQFVFAITFIDHRNNF